MRCALVTGASGFVGRPLVEALRVRAGTVHVVGRRDPGIPGTTFHRADLLDEGEIRAVVAAAAPSHLVHLAWYAEPGLYWRSPANLDWVCATLHLVRAFAEAGGTRVVAAGTCAEYAWGGGPLDEAGAPREPSTLYGAAKDATFRLLSAYVAEVGLSFAWGRLFFLYGPHEGPGRLVADAARALLAGSIFEASHGLQGRDFMHVADAAGAFAALAASDVRGAVNVATGVAPTVRSLLKGVAARAGRPDLIRLGAKSLAASEPQTIVADVSRLAREVGFSPRYDLAAGLDQTMGWWRERLAADRLVAP